MVKLALISFVIFLCSVSICAADESLTDVTNVAMDRLKDAAHRGANIVDKGADHVIVQVEKLANPPPHEPGQSNIAKSAIRGAGRYSGGVVVEAGRTARDYARASKKFIKNFYGLTKDSLKQAGRRLYYGRKLSAQNANQSNSP